MRETAVARRYASAFAEAFSDDLETVGSELAALADVFEDSRELKSVMLNPAIPGEVKKRVVDEALGKAGVHKSTSSAVRLVIEKGRFPLLKTIAGEFEKIAFETLGKVRIEITSAMELTEDERKEISEKLTRITGKKAVIDIKVDPSLIGGIVARIGSKVYDGSVRNQLKALRV